MPNPVFHFPTKEERTKLIRQMNDLAAQGQLLNQQASH